MIVCDEKIMRIPYGDEVLIVQGDRSGKGKKLKLSIISCDKTQKYIKRGCPIFLAQITKKETKDKSEEKRLEDVPMSKEEHAEHLKLILELLKKEELVGRSSNAKGEGAGDGEVRGSGMVLGLAMSCPKENLDGAMGDVCGDSRGVEGGAIG
ncbi:hypothetical protein Tco_1073238 [Tanacetum coccineum]